MLTTKQWKNSFPGACVGLIVIDKVTNPEHSEVLDEQKRMVENELRTQFPNRTALLENPIIKTYSSYYKKYEKTYHVQQQIESVIFKNKNIPSVAGLVETMFMAELKNGLLTAGHDYDALQLPLSLDVVSEGERYVLMNGKEQAAKPGDMRISDEAGIISSIIHGPDSRTRITPDTKKVMFVAYAPPGIPHDFVFQHLSDMYRYIKLFAINAEVELKKIIV